MLLLTTLIAGGLAMSARAVVLWSDSGPRTAHQTEMGSDVLGGAVKRDDSANDTLYFKFRVDALSDKSTEEYFAALELFDGDVERLGIGNALKAWAYSAFFNTGQTTDLARTAEYIDLHSATPHVADDGTLTSYQFPQRGVGVTIVFKIQFVPGEDDLITVWLNPDLGPGANEIYQEERRTTRFSANASFDEIRLRHGGAGEGWNFSDIAVATSFSDFTDVSSSKPGKDFFNQAGVTLGFRAWQKEQGLPQSPIHALAQTPDGYIWLGCDDGIVRFDGIRFTPVGSREGLNCGKVRALLADRAGNLWIGSATEGLSRWQQGGPERFNEKLPSPAITVLAEDTGGRLWIGTERGLGVLQEGHAAQSSAIARFNEGFISALCSDRKGGVWVGVKAAGVFQVAEDRVIPLSGPDQDALKDTHCLLTDEAGQLWIAAGDDLLMSWMNGDWRHYKVPRLLAKTFIGTLAEDADRTIWAGSAGGGLVHLKENRINPVPPSSKLAGNLVEALLVDREGKLWVGTDSGLNRLRRKKLFALGQNEGLGFGVVQGLAEVSPGVTWAVKPSDGIYRWDGRAFSQLTAGNMRDSRINAILVTQDGVCWVAGANGLLRYKDPIAAADEVRVFKLPGFEILSLSEDGAGNLCAGTRQGKLFWLRCGEWSTQPNFIQTNAITAVIAPSADSLWVGTDGAGLYRIERGAIDHIDKADGLLSDVIRALYLDTRGALWIGTAGGGLSRWREGRLANFTTREGLPDDTVSQILEDDVDRLWLGTSGGIACVSKRGLDDFAARKTSAVYAQLFGREEGMLSEQCMGGFHPAGLKTKSGQLWFSTSKGAVVVEPRSQPTNAPVLSVAIEEILVDGVPSSDRLTIAPKKAAANAGSDAKSLVIKPGKHRIEVRYTGLNFDAPESLRFRYRLEGSDPDWVDAGRQRAAFYNYVPPGDYRFRVMACNADGIWSAGAAVVTLSVMRHFWQSWWFMGLAGVGFLSSVGGTVRFVEKRRMQKRLERLERERALERERTRIAQDLHDEMGAKLCRILFLSEHVRRPALKPSELQPEMDSIALASREVLQSLDEIVWAVNPRNDSLEHVASYIGQYTQDYFHRTGIECELAIPAEFPFCPLSSQTRHHLFLATHEALTNILKHSGATKAEVSMKYENGALEITVSDNGKGFAVPACENGNGTPGSDTGDGVRNMRQRLQDIGGECTIEAFAGKGTTIRFVLPLNGAVTKPDQHKNL